MGCGKINLLGEGRQKLFQAVAAATTTTKIRASKEFNPANIFTDPDRKDENILKIFLLE